MFSNPASLEQYVLAGSFAGIVLWESVRPLRRLQQPTGRRWLVNSALFLLCKALELLATGGGAVLIAIKAQSNPYGLLNHEFLPPASRFVLAILALDLLRYSRHYLCHSTWLWRFHQVHHSDTDFDLTTGLRFHPGESLVTLATNLAVIFVLAPPPAAVLSGEALDILLNFLNHANIGLPAPLERLLGRLLITPGIHSIHHSHDVGDQHHNYGVLFPSWDRLFGTYSSSPRAGFNGLQFGLGELQDRRSLSPSFLVCLPFRRLTARDTTAAGENSPVLH